MNNCFCKYDEYEVRTEVCRHCAAALPQQLEDGSLNPEWLQARCGFATASRAYDITKLVQKKKEKGIVTEWKSSADRDRYMDQLLAERLTGEPQNGKSVYSLNERLKQEAPARAAYSFFYDREVVQVGFIHHLFIERFGASPDGYVGDNGIIEIKNLDAAQHIKLLEGGEREESVFCEYRPQVNSGLACTNREFCDFISYCPTMLNEEDKLYVRTEWRNESEISALENSVRRFLVELNEKVERIRNRRRSGYGSTVLTEQLEDSIALAKKPNVVHARKGKVIQLVK